MTDQYNREEPKSEEPDFNYGVDEDRAKKILERRARKVSREDIEDLSTTLREKVKDLKELEDGLYWIGSLIGRAKLLYAMIRDKGFRIDMAAKLMIAAGLIYFVVPTDMMPDFIPGIGYIDDALVLGTLWKLVSGEVDRYVEYLEETEHDDESLDSLAFGPDEAEPAPL